MSVPMMYMVTFECYFSDYKHLRVLHYEKTALVTYKNNYCDRKPCAFSLFYYFIIFVF